MTVVGLLPPLLARRVQLRAVRHHHVVPAVRRGVPDRLVLAHEQDRDAGRQSAQGGGLKCTRFRGGERSDCGKGVVRCGCGDVVPCAGVGQFCLEVMYQIDVFLGVICKIITNPLVCDILSDSLRPIEILLGAGRCVVVTAVSSS